MLMSCANALLFSSSWLMPDYISDISIFLQIETFCRPGWPISWGLEKHLAIKAMFVSEKINSSQCPNTQTVLCNKEGSFHLQICFDFLKIFPEHQGLRWRDAFVIPAEGEKAFKGNTFPNMKWQQQHAQIASICSTFNFLAVIYNLLKKNMASPTDPIRLTSEQRTGGGRGSEQSRRESSTNNNSLLNNRSFWTIRHKNKRFESLVLNPLVFGSTVSTEYVRSEGNTSRH